MSSRSTKAASQRHAGLVVAAALLAMTMAACKTIQSDESTTSYAMASAPQSEAEARGMAETWGERYRANPEDPVAAIKYAQGLRGAGQRQQAAAVLEQASIKNPKNMDLLGAYGRAL